MEKDAGPKNGPANFFVEGRRARLDVVLRRGRAGTAMPCPYMPVIIGYLY